MKQFNRYRRRLTLALLASALLNITLLAALSATFRPVSAEGAAPPLYPKLAVAFLPAVEEPTPEAAAAESPRETARLETAGAIRETTSPVPVDGRETADAETSGGTEPADGAPEPLRGEAGRRNDAHESSALSAGHKVWNPSQDEFLILLQELISENLVYPRRARQRGIEGTVILELVIDAEGVLRSKRIERESGSSMLDRAAMALLDTVFPVSVKPGYDLDCSVSVSYRLN